jgi:hypothetical protein
MALLSYCIQAEMSMHVPDNTKPISRRRPILELALATWLRLAAAPVFCALAGLALFHPSAGGLCVSGTSTWALHDMGLMYLLMGVAHLPPWLTLIGQGLDSETSDAKDC